MDSSDFLRQILFQPYLVKKKTPYVRRTSPGTRMFLLTIYLPWLLNMLPYSYWALTCLAVLPTYSAFMISVRQASDLPPASFRFPVTQDTLALGYILPAVGRIGDFHPLKHAPAGRTKNSGRYRFRYLPLSVIFRSAPRILRHDSHPASQHLRTLRPPVSDFHPDQGLLPSGSGNTRLRSQGSSRSPYLRPRSDSTIFRSPRHEHLLQVTFFRC